MCSGEGQSEGNWVGRSGPQETLSTSFDLIGTHHIFSILLHQNCLMAAVGSVLAAVISPKTVKDEEKVCLKKKMEGEGTATEL